MRPTVSTHQESILTVVSALRTGAALPGRPIELPRNPEAISRIDHALDLIEAAAVETKKTGDESRQYEDKYAEMEYAYDQLCVTVRSAHGNLKDTLESIDDGSPISVSDVREHILRAILEIQDDLHANTIIVKRDLVVIGKEV